MTKSNDPLTGAYNRKKGVEILSEFSENMKNEDNILSICLVDIKNLSYINKKIGLRLETTLLK